MQADRFALSRRGLLLGALALAGAPRAIAAQTPTAKDFPPFADRFGELFGMVPPMPDDLDDPPRVAFTWCDVQRQLGALGVPRPSGEELPDGFRSGTMGLPMTHSAFRLARDPRWADTFGFEPLTVHRFLEVGVPGNSAAIFAGVDATRVREALLASGYTEVASTDHGLVLTFGDEMKLDTTVSQLGTTNVNQAVLLDDIAIFGRYREVFDQVPAVIAGDAPAAADHGGWSALAGTLADDVVGAIALTPEAFSRLGNASAIREAIFAMRAGADDADIWEADDRGESLPRPTTIAEVPSTRAHVQVRIRVADASTATREAEEIPARWASMTAEGFGGLPYAELMLVEKSGTAEMDPTVVAIDFRVLGPASRWREIIERRDLAPFVPAE